MTSPATRVSVTATAALLAWSAAHAEPAMEARAGTVFLRTHLE